jgi:uncharacterized protein (DUF1499 family)
MTIGATIKSPASKPRRGKGGKWLLLFAVMAALLPLVGSYGSGFGLWHFRFGLLAVAASIPLAIIVLLAVLIQYVRGKVTLAGRAGIALLIALAVLGVTGYWARAAFSVPPIHDVTTHLANPPAFEKLPLRKDNLVGVETTLKWQELHRAAYGDVQPILLNMSPEKAMAIARNAVADRGWDVALSTPSRIEATETVSPFRFKDDVVILVSPTPTGGSEIAMRSVSRVGVSDMGVNASRLRALSKDIRAAAGEKP